MKKNERLKHLKNREQQVLSRSGLRRGKSSRGGLLKGRGSSGTPSGEDLTVVVKTDPWSTRGGGRWRCETRASQEKRELGGDG